MKHVFFREIITGVVSDLGAVEEIARQQMNDRFRAVLPSEVDGLIKEYISQRSVPGCEYVVSELCQTCKQKPGDPRVDHKLSAGHHCDVCWQKMVAECRKMSF